VLGFPALAGNRIEVLDDAGRVFDVLVADIDRARTSCDVCFYIWHEGGRTAAVVEALARAAERGVRCRALADAIGSRPFLSSASARRLRDAGVELITALPTGPLRSFFVRRDLRNHRKLVSIDQRVAYTGSLNLVDPRCFKQDAGVGEWVDAMVRLTGPAAVALDGVFALDWVVETGAPWYLGELPETGERPAPSAHPGAVVQVVPSGPDLRPKAIYQLLLTVIYGARRELVMTTPYFVPDEAILTALVSAAHRGVAVTLLVPAHNDSMLVRHASAATYEELAAAGVCIALHEGGLLHTKSLVVDGETSVFGSVNLDMRSLYLNFEISLFVYDRAFAGRLRALQDRYLESAPQLDLEAWRRRPALRRFQENLVRLIGPLL
jgi:cardiolipin synthase